MQLARLRYAAVKESLEVQTIYVDGNAHPSIQKGNAGFPFATLQQGLDAVEGFFPQRIVIASGQYLEEITYDPTGKRVWLQADGHVDLGTFTGNSHLSEGTRFNINLIGDPQNIDGQMPIFAIGKIIDSWDAFVGLAGGVISGFSISGQINANFDEVTSSCGLWVDATVEGTTGNDTGNSIDCPNNSELRLWLLRCNLRGKVLGGTNCQMYLAEQTRFQGSVALDRAGQISNCRMDEDWTVVRGWNQKQGFENCQWKKAGAIFTGGTGDMITDAASLKTFRDVGGVLAGGATVDFMGKSETLVWSGGAAAPSNGEHLEYNGGVAGTPAALGVSTEFPTPEAGTLTKISWNSDSGDVDTVLNIVADTSVVGAVTLDGASGTLPIPELPEVADGVKLAVELESGTAPGNILVSVFMQ